MLDVLVTRKQQQGFSVKTGIYKMEISWDFSVMGSSELNPIPL